MNTDELVAKVRLNTTTEDTDADYTASVVLGELHDSLTTKFERMVTDADGGYWIQPFDYAIASGQVSIRLPPRAIGMSKVEIAAAATGPAFCRLPQCSENQANLWQMPVGSIGSPQKFVLRGDQVVFLPTADNGGYVVRVWYFIRPSRLYPSQNAVSGTDRGRITALNATTRTVTVNALPFDMSLSSPAAITSALQTVDVVHPDGWHELAMVGATQTLTGLVITLGGTDDMSRVQVGDYVRVANQTDWPALPPDYHRCLADVTSVKILIQQDYQGKAAGYAQDVSADLERFSSLISQRVREEPKRVRRDLPSLRRGWY